MIKFRAEFWITSQESSEERGVIVAAESRDQAKDKIRAGVAAEYGCKPQDVEMIALQAEFSDPDRINISRETVKPLILN